jgi:translation initiation factor IF-3
VPPRRGTPDTRSPGQQTRINDAIRVDKVRLIDDEGQNHGVVPIQQAQEIANTAGLDLVEVAADARPPVVRIMDYGKWRYEQEQKAKQARRHQSTITIKEIKFRPKIDPHDYETKKGHVTRFLRNGDKVKVSIMFRGRELLHPERGEAILLRLADELKELASIESRPNLDGRNMIMMLAPLKAPQPGQTGGGAKPRKDEGGEAAASDGSVEEAFGVRTWHNPPVQPAREPDDGPCQALGGRAEEAPQGPRGRQGVLGHQEVLVQACEGAGQPLPQLRVPGPTGPQARLPPPVDRQDQRGGP